MNRAARLLEPVGFTEVPGSGNKQVFSVSAVIDMGKNTYLSVPKGGLTTMRDVCLEDTAAKVNRTR